MSSYDIMRQLYYSAYDLEMFIKWVVLLIQFVDNKFVCMIPTTLDAEGDIDKLLWRPV